MFLSTMWTNWSISENTHINIGNDVDFITIFKNIFTICTQKFKINNTSKPKEAESNYLHEFQIHTHLNGVQPQTVICSAEGQTISYIGSCDTKL